MAQYDTVIRGAMLVDGSGSPARSADLAIEDGTITRVGKVEGRGTREIDADGALVIPGWVDIHTHYDGQATWDSRMAPSSWHGVTTAVMGNCGVGFAPVRSEDHVRLIELMEGVEDIPGTAMYEGLKWNWSSFGEFLDALDSRPHDVDIGTYVPHDPLRIFVMGDRGAEREPATADEIDEMARLVRMGIDEGGLGFSTDRAAIHKTIRGENAPSFGAANDECVGIARALRQAGRGVLQLVTDFDDIDADFALMRDMAEASGRPLAFNLSYSYADTGGVNLLRILRRLEEAQADGFPLVGVVAPRAIGLIFGLTCSLNPFSTNEVFKEIENLPLPEKVNVMSNGDYRRRLLSSLTEAQDHRIGSHRLASWQLMYEMTDPPNYEPDVGDNILALAGQSGRKPEEVVYDLLLKDGGKNLLYVPSVNYGDGNLDTVKIMLEHRYTLPGLSDGGAHVGAICDASSPTTLLAHWGRDRDRGRIAIPYLVQQQCAATAEFVGLLDRGIIAPGYRADLNIIDLDNLILRRPEIYTDLPAGGARLMQRADGYLHTLVKGVVTYEDGVPTGSLPGRLVRGAQGAPA